MAKGNSTTVDNKMPEEFKPYFNTLLSEGRHELFQPRREFHPGRNYDGLQQAERSNATMDANAAVRQMFNRGTPVGLDRAMQYTRENTADMQRMGDQDAYNFRGTQTDNNAGMFDATGVRGYDGFDANTIRSDAKFSRADADTFRGFDATNARGYSGFRETDVNPYSGFEANKAKAYDGTSAYRFSRPDGVSKYNTGDAYEFSQFNYDAPEKFTSNRAEDYMSPYMDRVVDVQKNAARKDFDMAQSSRDAQAVQAGAFGGSRQGVQQALAQNDMLTRMSDIRATGSQKAFEAAQGQFNTQQGMSMQSQIAQAAERARVQGSQSSENARADQFAYQEQFARQSANSGQGMQYDQMRAAEAARVQAAGMSETSRVQSMNTDEFARVQSSQAAERARVQGISVSEAARLQSSEAAELARTQGISVSEAARIQAARASEHARVDGINVSETGRVQEERSRYETGIAQFNANQQTQVDQMRAAELARVQNINVAENARVQAAQVGEINATQSANVAENNWVQSNQNGANLAQQQANLGALQASNAGAQQIADITQTARQDQIQNTQLLSAVGAQNDQYNQTGEAMNYANYQNIQSYDANQLQNYNAIVNGLPVMPLGSSTTTQRIDPMQQVMGAGLSGLGLFMGL